MVLLKSYGGQEFSEESSISTCSAEAVVLGLCSGISHDLLSRSRPEHSSRIELKAAARNGSCIRCRSIAGITATKENIAVDWRFVVGQAIVLCFIQIAQDTLGSLPMILSMILEVLGEDGN